MAEDKEFEAKFFEDILSQKKDYVEVVKLLSAIYSKQADYKKSLKMDKLLVSLTPDNETAHYNLACTLALLGKKASAIKALRESFRLGFRDLNWLLEDPDMEELKDYDGFQKLIEEFNGELDLNF